MYKYCYSNEGAIYAKVYVRVGSSFSNAYRITPSVIVFVLSSLVF